MGPELTETPPSTPSGVAPPRGGRLVRAIVIAVSAMLVVVVGTITLVTFLFQTGSPFLSSRIMGVINRAVATDSTRFVSDRVHGTLFRGAVVDSPRLLVRTPGGEMTWARAKSMRIEYDLIGLAMGRQQDFRVEVEGPYVDLLHDSRGEMVLPKFARKRAGGRPSRELRVDIVLRDGGFALDRNDIRFGGIGGRAVLVIGPERSSLRLDRMVGSSRTPGRPGAFGVSGDLTIDAGVLRAQPLEITMGGSRLTARAGWDLAEARVLDGRVELHPLQLQEFFKAFQLQSPDGVVRGEVTFTGTPTAGEARACLDGTYAGETIDTLVVVARSRPGAVDFSGLRMLVKGTEFTGEGTLHTKGLLTADLGFRGVNPAGLPWWKPPEAMPQGTLNGRIRVTARRIAPRPDATLALTLAPSRVGRLEIVRGSIRLDARPNGTATFDSSWIQVPGGFLSARGRLGSDRSLDAVVDGRVSDLSRLNPLLGAMAAESGSGRVTGRITGTVDDPRFVAQADLYQSRFTNGAGGDTVTVEAQGRILPRLDLTADIGIRHLRFRDRDWGDLDAIVTGGSTLRVERFRQTLGDTVLALRGEVTFAQGGVSARVDSLSLVAGEHRVRNRGSFRLASGGEHLRVNDLVLELDPGTLIADLDWNPGRGTVDLRARVEGVDLSRVPELKRRPERFAGVVHGDILASGAIADPEIELRLDVVEPTFGEFAGDSLTVDVDYVPGVLTVHRALWTAEASRLTLSGSVRPSLPFQEWTRALGKRDRAWAARAPLALAVSADSFDLSLLAPVDTTLRSLAGIASLRARIGGTASAPVIDLTAGAPWIRFRGVDGAIPSVELAYDSGRLLVNRFEVRQDDAVSQIRGELPLDLSLYAEDRLVDGRPLSLTVEIPNGDLSVAKLLFPEIGTSSGAFGASARLSGTWEHPHVTGSARVSNGRIRLAGRDEVIDRIVLDAAFDEERLTISNATGRQGEKGRIQASGTWRWPAATAGPNERARYGPPGVYKFHVTMSEFTATDRENYLLRMNGELDIENVRHPAGGTVPRITGRVLVTKGELTLDLAKPPGDPGEPTPFLYYITVEIPGNFFYRNLDAEVELESPGSPLIFRNDGAGDLALGMLEVRSGKYYVVTREFRNLQGTVNFNNPDRIDPEVNIQGETSLPTPEGTPATVYLSLTDRMSRLKINVYDDAGTAPNELWKALAFGQFVRGYNVSSADASGADASVIVPISNYLFQNVERWLGSTGFIDTIDLRGGGASADAEDEGNSPISAFGVGKYVTPELYFKYSREFSGETDEQISADYRVTRHLLLKGQQIRDLSGTEETEYNLDLKIRLEY